ncbi:TetR/AcrR family transcriptional regulator [Streptococcus caprae]|uniref:TetR/AcrR family transcriptional regulator n=1 Tax=Streptococcus caprae TaxID=1640501 RepID=A0ABV8CYN9_9STRE
MMSLKSIKDKDKNQQSVDLIKEMSKIRQTETKTYIKEALTQLLKETDFERLTISQITKKAGINRGTFYLHYTDKYE